MSGKFFQTGKRFTDDVGSRLVYVEYAYINNDNTKKREYIVLIEVKTFKDICIYDTNDFNGGVVVPTDLIYLITKEIERLKQKEEKQYISIDDIEPLKTVDF